MDLLKRLEIEQANLTASESQIARYLIAHYPQAILGSASSIARATKISAATVVRFFAKLGYQSFAEAQEEIRREVALKMNSPIDRMGIADSSATSTASFLERFVALEVDNLRATFQQIDTANFDAVIDSILATRGKIYIIGEKNSHPIAFFLWAHLNVCLDNVVLVDTGQAMVADRLLWAKNGDLLVCVSIRRYSPNGVKAAQYFRAIGADVVVLTDNALSPLMPHATFRLLIQTASVSVFDSFTAMMSVAGAIAGVVERLRRNEVYATLKRGEDLWARFATFLR
ncbi:MAG TPA: MurR/RpiR family transcriptional regulator [Tardiphaga sp.]